MFHFTKRISISAAIILILTCRGVSAEVVYDSLSGTLFQGGESSVENGQSMTLGGTARLITRIDLRLSSTASPENYQVILYNIDSTGFPTTSIWTSPLQFFRGGGQPFIESVDVPKVEIPNSFAWSVRRVLPSQLLTRFADLPSIGNQIIRFRRDFGPWISEGSSFTLGATIFAVPEPASISLLLFGLVTANLSCRHRGRRNE
jgi:hypothetical protein